MTKKQNILQLIKNGVWFQNPVLVLLLGMCPMLAISTSVENALGMGVSAIAVLTMSNFTVSLLRKFITPQIRIAAYIVIIAALVTAVDLLIKAFLPDLSASLGIFIPLIAVNCIILARAEAFASKNTPLRSMFDGLAMGAGFTLALVIVAAIREVLGSGTFLGVSFFLKPAGGFLTLGLVIAAMQKIMRGRKSA